MFFYYLASRMTTAILIGCSILTTSNQFFGHPIHCHLDADVMSLQVTLKD